MPLLRGRRSSLPRPSGRSVRRGGLGLVLGIAGGWLAGLLRAPKR